MHIKRENPGETLECIKRFKCLQVKQTEANADIQQA